MQKHSADLSSAHFNLWLLAERLTNALNVSRTIFIPKVSNAKPLEYQPISICSHITRVFHKIFASRFERLVPLSIKPLIDYAEQAGRSISLCFIDVKKAFDSVSNGSRLAALKLNGVPQRLREYIGNVYSGATTVLEYGGRESGLVSLSRGVRQDDT